MNGNPQQKQNAMYQQYMQYVSGILAKLNAYPPRSVEWRTV